MGTTWIRLISRSVPCVQWIFVGPISNASLLICHMLTNFPSKLQSKLEKVQPLVETLEEIQGRWIPIWPELRVHELQGTFQVGGTFQRFRLENSNHSFYYNWQGQTLRTLEVFHPEMPSARHFDTKPAFPRRDGFASSEELLLSLHQWHIVHARLDATEPFRWWDVMRFQWVRVVVAVVNWERWSSHQKSRQLD